MGHVFISYSRKNKAYAHRLVEDINKRGFDVWIDDHIDPGEDWFNEIEEAIVNCDAFIVIMSPASRKSRWVKREVMIADRVGKPIFPMLLAGREFGELINIQSINVKHETLPEADFYKSLATVSNASEGIGKIITPDRRMTQTTEKKKPLLWIVGVVVAFLVIVGIIGVFVLNRGGDDALTEDGQPVSTPLPTREIVGGVILEITQEGSRLNARSTPSLDEDNFVELLYWGDRVLWRGKVVSAEDKEWLEVQLGSGETAYVANDASYFVERDLAESMAGLEVGATIRVTESGSGGHLRVATSTGSREIKSLEEGETLSVVGGPVNSEYYLWWQLETSDGKTGYAVEVPGWWAVE